MSFKIVSIFVVAAVFLAGCQDNSLLPANIKVTLQDSRPAITHVKIQNDQLIVSGSNLSKVTSAKIEGGTNHIFTIESKTENQIVLNAKSALSFLVGQSLNLIVSSASASATFPVSFELQNGQVTAAKLHHMGASAGQFLRFNGTSWVPSSVTTNQVYVGTYDAASDTPNLTGGVATAGTYYIVTVAGTQDLGTGSTNYNVGDWVISDGTNWSKVAVGTNTVSNFNGRTGAVVPLSGDYSWSMLTKAAGKLTGSKLQEIADIDVAGIQDGDILQWNAGALKWEVNSVPAPVITAGSISNTQIANSAIDSNKIVDGTIVNADISATAAIDQSKINGLTTALTGKEPSITAGTAAQYWSGTKSWQSLNPAVIGSTLTGYSASAGAVTAADSILSAINKLSGNIGLTTASQANYVLKAGDTMSGALAMGGNKITGLATPTVGTDAATMAYVDSKVGAAPGDNLGNHTATTNLAMGGFNITNAGKIFVADGAWNNPTISFENSTSTGLYYGGSNVGFSVNGGLAMNLSPSVLQMNGTYGGYIRGTGSNLAAAPTYSFGGDTNTGMFNLATDILGFSTDGVEKMRILSTGEILIGKTASAAGKLDVAGDIASEGKFRLKSDNTNYVELRAPAGLAATTTYTFPATAGSAGHALITDGAGNLSWSAVSGGTPADGSIGYAKLNLADGDIPLAKLAGTSDATKYLKGDKSWGTFITDVLASTFATVTPSNTVIANGDSLSVVVNKTQGQINNLASNSLNKTGADSITGTLTINPATGALKIPATPSGVDQTDAANVQYVQTYVGTYGQWIKNVTDISYSAGKVGVGTTSPLARLSVQDSLLSSSSSSTVTPTQFMVNDAPTISAGRVASVGVFTQPSPSASGASQFNGILVDLTIPAASTSNIQAARAINAINMHNGSGVMAGQHGATISTNANGTGTITSQIGISTSANTSSTVTVTNQTGINATANHSSGTAMTSQTAGRASASLTSGTVANQYGLYATATNTISSSVTSQFGINGTAVNSSTSTVSNQWGTYGSAVNSDAGTVTLGKGVYGQAFSNGVGTITEGMGVHGEIWNNGSGTITNGYALYGNVQRPLGGTITNGYGLYLGNIDATNKWSVYANDPTSPSYFAGNVGIGTTTPQASLEINSSGNTIINNSLSDDTKYTALRLFTLRGNPLETMGSANPTGGNRGWELGANGNTYPTTAMRNVFTMNHWNGTAWSTPMAILPSGNIGIGTLAPAYKLQVNKTATAVPALMIGGGFSGGPRIQSYGLDQNPLAFMGLGSDMSGDPYDHSIYTSGPVQNGKITFGQYDGTTYTERMRVNGDGNVGIGITTPGYKLHVNGSVAGVGAYNALSDRRYKKDFEKIPDALERVVALNGFFYKWRQEEHPDMQFEKGRDMGVIAQEVQKVFPEAVSMDKKSGFMSVAYSKLIAPIIEAIKELFSQSQKHEREIASLKEENRLLKESLCEINPKAKICKVSKSK